jgi:DNA-binding Lrp family transcriptional regulator
VDALDFRLLVALHEDARQSYRALGRAVGLSAPSVRDRLERFERTGLLKGFWLRIDARAVDRADAVLLFDGAWTRADAARALAAPDVAWVAWKVDGRLSVGQWARGDPELAASGVASVLGARPTTQTVGSRVPLRTVSLLDWRILDALLDNPRVDWEDLCRRTGLTGKTVRRRVQNLIRDGVATITPILGSLADSGDIVYTVSIFGPVEFSEVHFVLGDAALLRRVEHPPAQFALCRATSLADVLTRTTALGRLPGVSRSFVSLNRELLVNLAFERALIRERLAA